MPEKKDSDSDSEQSNNRTKIALGVGVGLATLVGAAVVGEDLFSEVPQSEVPQHGPGSEHAPAPSPAPTTYDPDAPPCDPGGGGGYLCNEDEYNYDDIDESDSDSILNEEGDDYNVFINFGEIPCIGCLKYEAEWEAFLDANTDYLDSANIHPFHINVMAGSNERRIGQESGFIYSFPTFRLRYGGNWHDITRGGVPGAGDKWRDQIEEIIRQHQ